jgi:hypothetical protein
VSMAGRRDTARSDKQQVQEHMAGGGIGARSAEAPALASHGDEDNPHDADIKRLLLMHMLRNINLLR